MSSHDSWLVILVQIREKRGISPLSPELFGRGSRVQDVSMTFYEPDRLSRILSQVRPEFIPLQEPSFTIGPAGTLSDFDVFQGT